MTRFTVRAVAVFAAALVPSLAAAQGARPTCDADNGGITLPQGFCALVIADSLGALRHVAVAPNGDLYVADGYGLSWIHVFDAQRRYLRTLGGQGATLAEIRGNPAFGDFGGQGWEWVANFFALGGLFLLWKRIIPWQVPVATLGTVLLLALPFWLYEPDLHPSPLQHVFSGGLVLAAFFIATDPLTGCTTPRGRLLFGAGVAALTLAIRRWGVFPDGVAFAVLLMNCAAPWIDRQTRPRILGEARPGQDPSP